MNKPPITAVAPWMGSKRQLSGRIIETLGEHHAYFEPFCGSMAVILNKPLARHEVVNDLNRDIVNVATVLKTRPLAAELLVRLHFTLAAEELYRESRRMTMEPYRGRLGDVDRAYHALVMWWLGRNGIAGTKPSETGFSARFTARGGSGGVRFRNLVSSIPWFAKRLERVDVLNQDAITLIDKIPDEPGAVVYCDPPYFVKAKKYQHDFESADHDRLAKALGRFKRVRIVLSYYPHPRLEALYPPDRWNRIEICVTKNIRNTVSRGCAGVKATEVLLVNGDIIPESKEKGRERHNRN